MRSILLAGICLAALSGTAKAQIPVTDLASVTQQIKGYVQEIKSYSLQAQQYVTAASQLETEVTQLNALVHSPSYGAALGLMNQAGLTNSLPINPAALQGLASGNTSLSGILGTLGSLANGNYNANTIYRPNDGSWNSNQLNANGQSIAGNQGAAQSVYASLREHLPIIAALSDKLKTAQDPKDVMDATAQIEAETLFTHNLSASLQAIEVNYRAEQDSRKQRDEESLSKGINDWLAQAKAEGRGL